MKDWLLIALAALILLAALALPFGAALALTQEEQQLQQAYESGEIIRLHVLAHSDAQADQALKLQVRDALLACGSALFSGDATPDTAAAMLRQEAAQGISHVIATPHFYARYDDPEVYFPEREQAFLRLRRELEVHPGLPEITEEMRNLCDFTFYSVAELEDFLFN